MGVDKHRRKASFLDGATFTGSVGFSGPVLVNSTAVFSAPVTLNSSLSLNGALHVNTPMRAPAGSASNQFFGVTQLNSDAATVVISTTAVRSLAATPFISLTPRFKGTQTAALLQTSGTMLGGLAVISLHYGGFFTAGWTGGSPALTQAVDVMWEVKYPQ